jgi:hypothetical protein
MSARTSAALSVLAGLLVAGCGGTAASRTAATPAPAPATAPATASAPPVSPATAPPPRSAPPRPPAPPPGTLPQTDQLPSAGTHSFHAEMAALWRAVVRDSVRAGRRAFFPEAAYLRLKTLGDPAGDFTGRLLVDFGLDLDAAHRLLGSDPGAARLVGVRVPTGFAHWVPPGVCDNRVGYYEVPNARVLYTSGGELRSFGIASMISWRGVWYVVHLGAVLRPVPEGIVDDAAVGPGVSAPSSTC